MWDRDGVLAGVVEFRLYKSVGGRQKGLPGRLPDSGVDCIDERAPNSEYVE